MAIAQDNAEFLAARIDDLMQQCEHLDTKSAALAIDLKAAVEAFHAAGLRDLISHIAKDKAASEALRTASQQPSVYTLLRRHSLIKASLQEQVLNALELVKPELKQHGGDVRLVGISPPDTVEIQLLGACDGCGSSEITLKQGIETVLREQCSWIRHIHAVPGNKPREHVDHVRVLSPFEARFKQSLEAKTP